MAESLNISLFPNDTQRFRSSEVYLFDFQAILHNLVLPNQDRNRMLQGV